MSSCVASGQLGATDIGTGRARWRHSACIPSALPAVVWCVSVTRRLRSDLLCLALPRPTLGCSFGNGLACPSRFPAPDYILCYFQSPEFKFRFVFFRLQMLRFSALCG